MLETGKIQNVHRWFAEGCLPQILGNSLLDAVSVIKRKNTRERQAEQDEFSIALRFGIKAVSGEKAKANFPMTNKNFGFDLAGGVEDLG